MLLIYIDRPTNRLGYIINLIFKEILDVDFMVTTSKETFIAEKGGKLSYSKEPIYDEVHITSTELLFETSVNERDITFGEVEGLPAMFLTYGKNDSMGFDFFAAAFYLVSRYEEYLIHGMDLHGRFPAKESLAFKHGFLEKPIVNLWAKRLKEILLGKYPNLEFAKKKFSFVNTLDIDMAYCYKHKGVMRSLGGVMRDIVNLDFYAVSQRFKVLFMGVKDPYACNDFIQTMEMRYKCKTILFYLFAMRTKFDKCISPYNRSFQLSVKDMSDYCKIGIHPSYYCIEDDKLLAEQKKLLEQVIHKKIFRSRFHYLRFNLPASYRNLLDNEISEDFSMGYADAVGFRAGVASSFNFYDLERDCETNLRVYPFMCMDVALKNALNLDTAKAKKKIQSLIDAVKEVDGQFISIWHNESLSNYRHWEGWRNVYECQMDYISQNITK